VKIFILLIGIGGGVVNGATNALVSDISEREKGADLSLLGVFYGIGALGMPVVLGMLKDRAGFEMIVSAVGLLPLLSVLILLSSDFPSETGTGSTAYSKPHTGKRQKAYY